MSIQSDINQSIYGTNNSSSFNSNNQELSETDLQRETLRKALADKLHDIDHIDAILNAYYSVLITHIPKDKLKSIEEWLVDKIYFLGSKYYNHDSFYKHFGNVSFSKEREFKQAFDQFVTHLQQQVSTYSTALEDTSVKVQKSIAILFPKGIGGGHSVPATALSTYLKKQGHLVTCIDIDEVERPYDPKIEGMTKAEVYSEVYQKEGDVEKANRLWIKADQKQPLGDKRYMADIRKIVRDVKADEIIAVAHHMPSLSAISYQLGIPMTYLHTEHTFHQHLIPLVTEQEFTNRKMLTFTSPSADEAFFENLATSANNKELLDAKKLIVPVDIPVRESFHPVSIKEVAKLRKQLSIAKDVIVCKIAMGQNGIATETEEILKRICEEQQELTRPFHIIIACGKNVQLKESIEQYLEKRQPTPQITFDVRGFMEEADMALYDKVADIWISKPGGSVTAEAVKLRKPMLYVLSPLHQRENANALFMKSLGLGEELSKSESILKQINRIYKAIPSSAPQLPHTNWKRQISSLLFPQTPAEQFCNAVKSKFKLDINTEDLWAIGDFIENDLPKKVEKGNYYHSSSVTHLAYSLEHDPITKLAFIHLNKKIGSGKAKKCKLSLLYHPEHPQQVVKLYLKNLSDKKRQARHNEGFKKECTILQKTRNAKYLVNALAMTKKDKRKQVFQELYAYGNLRHFLKNRETSQEESIRFSTMMLKGLKELHELGYIHRDLHKGNFLVGENLDIKIADFGHTISKEEAKGTYAQAAKHHRSPESIFCDELQPNDYEKTDLFALGTSLYEIIYNRSPEWMANDKLFPSSKTQFSPEQKVSLINEMKAAILEATNVRRNELVAKKSSTSLNVMETLEYATMQLIHPEPTERKDAGHWVAMIEEARDTA